MIAGLGSAVLLLSLLEMLYPYARRWRQPVGPDAYTDVLTYLGNRLLATQDGVETVSAAKPRSISLRQLLRGCRLQPAFRFRLQRSD